MGYLTAGGHSRHAGRAILHFTVAALAGVFLLALAGLVVVEVHPAWLAGLRNGPVAPAPLAGNRHGSRPGARRATSPPVTRPGAGTAAAGGPVLVGLEPASGAAGDTLTVSGANLFSSDGTVLATFDGRPAPTRCPSERRCLVTVPAMSTSTGTATIRMRTSKGLSNGLAFHYR